MTSTHLGLAHGTSFILALLAKTNLQGYFKAETEELIHKGLAHFKSLKNENIHSGYVNPMVVLNGKPETGGRLAWCNGDLGVATAFWLGWKATKDTAYQMEALQILRSAKSKDLNIAGALDAGLCHGTGGIAQLFRRYYWETGEKQFETASDNWIAETLKMANYKDGYAGYKTYSSAAYGGPRLEYGFLSGISGIGIALLSALSDTSTSWDRVLQIS
jgi:lantibiotic modifying enzyme